jgi:hypothetical protein
MPASGDFDGVYGSDWGRMELTVSGDKVLGLFEAEKRHGRIEGAVTGDLLHFAWTQWNEDMQGKIRQTTGRGVFRYIVQTQAVGDDLKEEHGLEGTWGYDNSEVGNSWRASKNPQGKKQLQPREQEKNEMQTGLDYGGSPGFEGDESQPSKAKPDAKKAPVADEKKSESDDKVDLDGLF